MINLISSMLGKQLTKYKIQITTSTNKPEY